MVEGVADKRGSHACRIKAVTVDAADPATLAEFWAFALDYQLQPPPEGFETWEEFADALDLPAEDRERYAAVVDPNGVGPRVLFQKVPEGKTVKNRWHLDIDIVDYTLPRDQHDKNREAGIAALVERGATEVERFDLPQGKWVVMMDPEGNEVLRVPVGVRYRVSGIRCQGGWRDCEIPGLLWFWR